MTSVVIPKLRPEDPSAAPVYLNFNNMDAEHKNRIATALVSSCKKNDSYKLKSLSTALQNKKKKTMRLYTPRGDVIKRLRNIQMKKHTSELKSCICCASRC